MSIESALLDIIRKTAAPAGAMVTYAFLPAEGVNAAAYVLHVTHEPTGTCSGCHGATAVEAAMGFLASRAEEGVVMADVETGAPVVVLRYWYVGDGEARVAWCGTNKGAQPASTLRRITVEECGGIEAYFTYREHARRTQQAPMSLA